MVDEVGAQEKRGICAGEKCVGLRHKTKGRAIRRFRTIDQNGSINLKALHLIFAANLFERLGPPADAVCEIGIGRLVGGLKSIFSQRWLTTVQKNQVNGTHQFRPGLKEKSAGNLSPPLGQFQTAHPTTFLVTCPLLGKDTATGGAKTLLELAVQLPDAAAKLLLLQALPAMGPQIIRKNDHRAGQGAATAAGAPHAMTKPSPQLYGFSSAQAAAKDLTQNSADGLCTAEIMLLVTIADPLHHQTDHLRQ